MRGLESSKMALGRRLEELMSFGELFHRQTVLSARTVWMTSRESCQVLKII